MKLLELIQKLIPDKFLLIGLIVGICGLLIVGLIYGDISIIVGTIGALAMFKFGAMDK